jgi:DNA-binding NarL/FixJ family response regulator
MTIRVMVVENHPLFRDAVQARISQLLGDSVEFAYVGASLTDALSAHLARTTDCAILDLDLGDKRSPIANTSDLVEIGCKVLIVSALADPATVRASLRAGALGFISKQSPAEEFEAAFHATLAGEPSTSVDVAAILSGDITEGVGLSERERTALTLYASGLKIETVARRMNVKTATAQEYIKRVRNKYVRAGTPAPTKTDLYRQAREEGLVP